MKYKKSKAKILISSCLLEENVRYNQIPLCFSSSLLEHWKSLDVLVAFCPEVEGGMSVPRLPAELMLQKIAGSNEVTISVINGLGEEVTSFFQSGAEKAWKCSIKNKCSMAILKESSPSCGSRQVYDGHFSGNLIPGAGITTTLLRQQGVKVFSEAELETAYLYWCSL